MIEDICCSPDILIIVARARARALVTVLRATDATSGLAGSVTADGSFIGQPKSSTVCFSHVKKV